MQFLPKTNPIRAWNPKRKQRAVLALELAKRRRKRAAGHGDDEPSVPNAPENLNITVNAADFFFTWDDMSDNEEGFRVYRSMFGEPFELIAELGADEVEFNDGAVEMGIVYTYYVVSFNVAGEPTQSNSVSGELTPAE